MSDEERSRRVGGGVALSSPHEDPGVIAKVINDEVPDGGLEARGETYEPLRKRVKYCFGLPQFSMLPLTLILTIFAPTYYVNFGASLSFIAFSVAVARSLDTITDPLMGWISDNTRLRFGRRRPYMLVGSFFFAGSFAMLMTPPLPPEDGGVNTAAGLHFAIFYIAFYLFDTLANVPYSALGPELTSDSQERTTVFFVAKIYSGVGTLIGATAPELVKRFLLFIEFDAGGDSGTGGDGNATTSAALGPTDADGVSLLTLRWSFLIVAFVFGAIYIGAVVFVVCTVRERKGSQETKTIPLVPSLLRSLKNRALRPLLLGWVLDAIALSSLASSFPFFITYVIQPSGSELGFEFTDSSTQAACFLALFSGMIIAMPLWKLVAGVIGKYYAFMGFNLLNAVTNFLFAFVGEGDPRYTIAISFLNGLPLGGQFLVDALLADVIDYDEFLNGTRNEGGFSVFATFIPKFVSVPAAALPLSIISMIGFRPAVRGVPQEQDAAVKNFIRLVFVVVPCSCALLSFWVKRSFPIRNQRIVDEINKGIELHSNGLPARDPITGEVLDLLKLSDDDRRVAHRFDNFGADDLRRLFEDGPRPLIKKMGLMLAFGGFWVVGLGVALVFTFELLDDAALNIIPIICVVLMGIGVSFTAVSFLRLKAALKFRSTDLDTIVLEKVIKHKEKGSRGGDGLELADEVLRYQRVIADLEERLASTQRTVDDLRVQVRHSHRPHGQMGAWGGASDGSWSVEEIDAGVMPRPRINRGSPHLRARSTGVGSSEEESTSETAAAEEKMLRTSLSAPDPAAFAESLSSCGSVRKRKRVRKAKR